jgi:dihydropyrimidine dehydrogenase (NAD+) subunit PreA
MAAISTKFCEKTIKSPLGVAALANYGGIAMANPRERVDCYLRAAEEGAGFITLSYTCTEDQKDYPKGKDPLFVWGMGNDGGLPKWGDQKYIVAAADEHAVLGRKDEVLEQIRLLKKELPKDVLIKADCIGPNIEFETWASHAKEFEQAGVDYMELDVSCTLTAAHLKTEWAVTVKEGFPTELMSNVPEALKEMLTKVKEKVKIPIGYKISPEAGFPRFIHIAKITADAGANFVTCTNAPATFNPIYIYNDGKPLTSHWPHTSNTLVFTSGQGRAQGRRDVSMIKMFVPEIEPVGITGIQQPEHVVDYIMLGAQVCESCSGYLYQGAHFYKRVNNWLSRYMDNMGYKSIDDFRGVALKHFKWYEDFDFEYGKWYAVTDTAKCNACGNCISLCAAPFAKGGKVLVDQDKCAGCFLCSFICPEDARTMVKREVPKDLDIAKEYSKQPWRKK